LEEEKKMIELYERQITQKENEIEKFNDLEGDELFKLFSEDEKIKNIKIKSKSRRNSTKAETIK
jgi:hypothetical protein